MSSIYYPANSSSTLEENNQFTNTETNSNPDFGSPTGRNVTLNATTNQGPNHPETSKILNSLTLSSVVDQVPTIAGSPSATKHSTRVYTAFTDSPSVENDENGGKELVEPKNVKNGQKNNRVINKNNNNNNNNNGNGHTSMHLTLPAASSTTSSTSTTAESFLHTNSTLISSPVYTIPSSNYSTTTLPSNGVVVAAGTGTGTSGGGSSNGGVSLSSANTNSKYQRLSSLSGWSTGGNETPLESSGIQGSLCPSNNNSNNKNGRGGFFSKFFSSTTTTTATTTRKGGYEGLSTSEDSYRLDQTLKGERFLDSSSASFSYNESSSRSLFLKKITCWRSFAFVLSIVCLGLVITLVATNRGGFSNGGVNSNGTNSTSGIGSGSPLTPTTTTTCNVISPELLLASKKTASFYSANNPHPFDDLYPEELESVRNFLLSNSSLRLTPFGNAGVRDGFIYGIELMPPTKASMLAFLDHNGPKPPRNARVIIYHGNVESPFVNEYLVGPLPITSSSSVQLWRGPIPWSMRPVAANEYVAWEPIISAAMKSIDQITSESYGTVYSDKKMFYTDNAPRGYTRNTRQSWIWMMFAVEGEYINCLGLEMQIIHYDLDPSRWYITNFVYNNQGPFATAEELLWQYNNNATFQKIRLPYPALAKDDVLPLNSQKQQPQQQPQQQQQPNNILQRQNDGISDASSAVWSSLFNRGSARPFSHLKSPRTYYPEGQRFTIDGRVIEYLGWHIHVTSSIRSGLNLRDIRFQNERVIYELAIQDAYAGYAGRQPSQATSNYFDSGWGMGWNSYELVRGVDCPETAAFMDMNVLVNSGHVMTLENSICLFEVDASGPMFRHYNKPKLSTKFSSVGGVRASHLILRTAVTVYNYDYIYDYIFHLDGTIEVRMSATGYLQGGYFQNPEDNVYGQQVHSDTMGNLHDHIIGYKIDFDIAGLSNSFQKMHFRTGFFPNNPYLPPSKLMKYVDRVTVPTEMKSTCVVNTTSPAYWNIVNLDQNNVWGTPRGYRIVPMATIVNIMPDQVEFMPAASWTKYNLAVTVRHEEEERSTESLYDMQAPDDPLVSFDNFLKNDESIVQQDLVAWVAVGMMHQPHAEDVPVTLTVGSMTGFVLKPHNYFNINPGTDLNQGRILRAAGNPGTVLPLSPLATELEHPPKSEPATVLEDTLSISEKCVPRELPFLYKGVPEYIHA